MARIVLLSIVVLLCVVCGAALFAQQRPPQNDEGKGYRDQAVSKINIANGLVTRAQEMIEQSSYSKDSLMAASELYLQAGRLFEEAGNDLQMAGPQYASQEDITNCQKAVNLSVTAIKNIREIIEKKYAPKQPPQQKPAVKRAPAPARTAGVLVAQ